MKNKKNNYINNKELELTSMKIRQNFSKEFVYVDKKTLTPEKIENEYINFRYGDDGTETQEFHKYDKLKNDFGISLDKIYKNYCNKPSFINYTYTTDEGYVLFIHNIYRYFFKKYKFGSKTNYKLEDFKANRYVLSEKKILKYKKKMKNKVDDSIKDLIKTVTTLDNIDKDLHKFYTFVTGDYIYVNAFDPYSYDKDEIGIDYIYNINIEDVIVYGVIESINGSLFTINGVEYDMDEISFNQHDNNSPLSTVTFNKTIKLISNEEKLKFIIDNTYENSNEHKDFIGTNQLEEIKNIVITHLNDIGENKKTIRKISDYIRLFDLKSFVEKNIPTIYPEIENIVIDKTKTINEVCEKMKIKNTAITDYTVENNKIIFSYKYIINSKLEREKKDKKTRLEKMITFLEEHKSIENIEVDSIYYIHNDELSFKKNGNPFSYITMMTHMSIIHEINNTNKVNEQKLFYNGLSNYDVDVKDQHKFREFENKYIQLKDDNERVFDELKNVQDGKKNKEIKIKKTKKQKNKKGDNKVINMNITTDSEYLKNFGINPLLSANTMEDILKDVEKNEILFIIFNNICKLDGVYYHKDTKNSKKNTIRKTLDITLSEFLNKAYDTLSDYFMYQLVFFLINSFENEELIIMCLNEYFIKIMKQEIVVELSN